MARKALVGTAGRLKPAVAKIGTFLMVAAFTLAAHGQAEPQKSTAAGSNPVTARLENARVDAIDSDYANLALTDCIPSAKDPTKVICDGKVFHVKVPDLALRAKLKPFHPGDHVRVDITNDELKDIRGPWSVPQDGICIPYRLLTLAACAAVLLGLAAVATKGKPQKFIVGMDNRYSNSKFQLALWFCVLITTYLSVALLRLYYAGWDFWGSISIPPHLLELSGLSVLTYGGAKAITTSKVNAAMNPTPVAVSAPPPAPTPVVVSTTAAAPVTVVAAAAAQPATFVAQASNPDPKNAKAEGQESFFNDLVKNDQGGVDFGDFQMLMVTILAVGMYLTLIFHFLGSVEFLKTVSLPDVDTTVLAGFGLGQGAYLAKKAGGDVGKS
jgi:hypothetical protein